MGIDKVINRMIQTWGPFPPYMASKFIWLIPTNIVEEIKESFAVKETPGMPMTFMGVPIQVTGEGIEIFFAIKVPTEE